MGGSIEEKWFCKWEADPGLGEKNSFLKK